MNFQVPQFIEVENKLIGPLTLKQFLYLAGGAGLTYLVFIINIPLIIRIVPMVAIIIFSLALAFYKVHEQPFINILDAGLKYVFSKKLYLWRQETKTKKSANNEKEQEIITQVVPKLSESKLNDLAWNLDIKDNPDQQQNNE